MEQSRLSRTFVLIFRARRFGINMAQSHMPALSQGASKSSRASVVCTLDYGFMQCVMLWDYAMLEEFGEYICPENSELKKRDKP